MNWNHQYFYKEKKIVALDLPAYASGTRVYGLWFKVNSQSVYFKGFLMHTQYTSASVR